MASKNINWINAIKAICMILIYFVHGQTYYDLWLGDVNHYIHPIYVNAFFFVSGYLLFRKQLSSPVIDESRACFVSKKGNGRILLENLFYRMWVPCMIFSIIEFVPKKIIKGGVITMGAFLNETVGGGTYWFVSALMLCEMILLFLFLSRNRNIWFYFVILLMMTTLGLSSFLNNISHDYSFYSYPRALMSCCFVGVGGLYWKYESYIERFRYWIITIGLLLYVYVFTFYSDDVQTVISLNLLNSAGIIFSSIGIIVLIELCKFLPTIKYLTFIGTNTLLFYFVSGAVPLTVNLFFKRIIPGTSALGLIVYLFVIFGIASLITYFIQRYLYPLLDLRVLKKQK